MQTFTLKELETFKPYKYKPSYDYFINKLTDNHFLIIKMLDSTVLVEYNITLNPWSCSCPSGIYRGYCKHKEMISNFINKKFRLSELQKELIRINKLHLLTIK